MDGDGGETVEKSHNAAAFDLPAVLAQLDDHDPTSQRQAVRRIRETIDEEPSLCLPTVPKLRALLGRPSIDFHDEIALSLAELAEESPADVAPSVDEIVSFAADNERDPATRELLRCLDAVATERPDAVVEHADAILAVLEERRGYDRWGLRLLASLSIEYPAAVEPASSLLIDALAGDPAENGVPALSALGRLARSDAASPALEFVDDAVALVDHDDGTLRNNAIGCLGDVAHQNPAAVEGACPRIATALESDDPNTRANAAVTIARVAAGAEGAVEPARERLVALLDDDHAHVRANACLALGYGGVDGAADRLATLAAEDPDPSVRERAAWAVDRVT
ncbi:HEAT repeat domain-containing protein [Halosolutus amylolyticus]|uniref:HEAT repeat domain-containing protein n=1 Tax=Halosolutus amylolyticus TaxID=2932267 RepID=A0ABD5PT23_9EURY|nr:HEAT repeat domain-containing protein [Halosolutus amylolyticus]